MSDFGLHPAAVKDLDEIWEYIAADNLDAADRTIEEIYETVQSLVPFPYIGTAVPSSPRSSCDSNRCAIT